MKQPTQIAGIRRREDVDLAALGIEQLPTHLNSSALPVAGIMDGWVVRAAAREWSLHNHGRHGGEVYVSYRRSAGRPAAVI